MKLLPVVTAFIAGLIVGLNLSAADPVGARGGMERGRVGTEYPPLSEQPQHIPPPPPGPYQSQSMLPAPVPPRAGKMDYAPLNYAPEDSVQAVTPSHLSSGSQEGVATQPKESLHSTVGKVPLSLSTAESQYPKGPREGTAAKPSSPSYTNRSQGTYGGAPNRSQGTYGGAPNRSQGTYGGAPNRSQGTYGGAPPAGASTYPQQGPAASAPLPPTQHVYPSYTEKDALRREPPRSNAYMPPSYNPYGAWSDMRHPYGTPSNPWQGERRSGFSDYPTPSYSPYQRPRYYAPRFPRP
jgi:hypothetical protein